MILSFVIVNYNSWSFLERCIQSIFDNCTLDYEVIIVDNASTQPGSVINSERVEVISLGENLGFSKANNIGLRISKGDYIYFLNPDTEYNASIDSELSSTLKDDVDVIVTRIRNAFQVEERNYHLIPFMRNFVTALLGLNPAYWYIGASVIMKKSVADSIGGWSEDYFFYVEDMDLFYKLYKEGYKPLLTTASILHYGGGSTKTIWNNHKRQVAIEKSYRIFYRKHFCESEYVLSRLAMLMYVLIKSPKVLLFQIAAIREVLRNEKNNDYRKSV